MAIKKKVTEKAVKAAAKKPAAPAKKSVASAKKSVTPAKASAAPAKKKAVPVKVVPSVKKAEVTAKKSSKKDDVAVKASASVQVKKSKKVGESDDVFKDRDTSIALRFALMMKKRQHEEDEAAKQAESIKLSRRPTSRTKTGKTQKFPAADLAQFRKSLLQLRAIALGQSAQLRAAALEQSDEHVTEDEEGSDILLRLQNLSQADSQNKIIKKIDEALSRIDDGSYGVCTSCGQLIRKPRLLNMPFAETCMECQSAMEHDRRNRRS